MKARITLALALFVALGVCRWGLGILAVWG